MFRRALFTTMRASIVAVPEAGPLSAAAAPHEAFLKAVGMVGKGGDADGKLYVAPDGSEAIAFVGLKAEGDRHKHADNIRKACSKGYLLLKPLKPECIKVDPMGHPQAAAEGVTLAKYAYDLKRPEEGEKGGPIRVVPVEGTDMALWTKGETWAGCQNYARRMADMPANLMTPRLFCEHVLKLVGEAGVADTLKVTVHDEKEIKALGMGCFLGVAQGSAEPPRLLVLQYTGNPGRAAVDYGLVGKGVTFDSGGISIKPAAGMGDMKMDMQGGAVVCAATIGAAACRAQSNIVCVVPLTENLPSDRATKPGDVHVSMAGLTVQVDNTDAEGRLILADALHYCQEQFQPATLIDVATLTGAMCVALGQFYSGVYASTDDLWARLHASGQATGDKVWRMPLSDDFDDLIKSEIADLSNIPSSRDGSANSAARFLQRFVRDGQAWAHIDMASAMSAPAYYGAKNRATGRTTRVLMDLLGA